MRVIGRLCVAAAVVLTVGACGGDDDDEASSGNTEEAAESNGDGADTDDGGSGESYGIFTVDGEELRYAMSDLEYSQVEAIDDVTLEDCDPSFFGAGFRVIGYPVDDNGDLVLADNGDIDGIVDLQLPNDMDDTELMDVDGSFDYGPAGINTRFRGDDTGQTAYEIDGNRVTGTIVLKNSRQEPTVVDFEIVCGDE